MAKNAPTPHPPGHTPPPSRQYRFSPSQREQTNSGAPARPRWLWRALRSPLPLSFPALSSQRGAARLGELSHQRGFWGGEGGGRGGTWRAEIESIREICIHHGPPHPSCTNYLSIAASAPPTIPARRLSFPGGNFPSVSRRGFVFLCLEGEQGVRPCWSFCLISSGG